MTDTGQACNAPPDFNATIALNNINDIKKIQDTECKGECTLGGGSKSEPVQNLNRFKTCTGSKSEPVQNLHHPHKENNNNIYNNINNISDKTDRYLYNNQSIHQSNQSINPHERMDKTDKIYTDKNTAKQPSADKLYEHMSALVRKNIDYDIMTERPECAGWYEEYYNLIVEVLVRKTDHFRISGEEYSAKLVQNRFINLHASDLLYVHTQMSRTTSDIKNIKAYLIKALFNAPTTKDSYWQNRVNQDVAKA